VPDEFAYSGLASIAGRRIATTYPLTLGRFLRQHGIEAEIVTLSGAVEIAPRLGRADLICDLVSTGSTLNANHLREVITVLESEAALIRTPVPLSDEKADWVRRLLLRIDGVQQVRESKYIMLHAPRSALAEIKKLLPGSESPTSSRWTEMVRGWPFMPSAGRTSSGRRSRAEGGRRERSAGAPGREDARMSVPLDILDWPSLAEDSRREALRRPAQRDASALLEKAGRIVSEVRTRGDAALSEFTAQFDGVRLESFAVGAAEFEAAAAALTREQIEALQRAIGTVTRFHETQSLDRYACRRRRVSRANACTWHSMPWVYTFRPVLPRSPRPRSCWPCQHDWRAAASACCARRPDRTARGPGRADGRTLCGIDQVFKLGGAQAVADGVRHGDGAKVDKIFGPGNSWVTAAKQIVAADADGAALDMPAGPSEVLVIADETARPVFVAADLLAQASTVRTRRSCSSRRP